MERKNFYSKVLLFGEYGIISNSNALSVPFKEFYGFLNKSTKLNQDQKHSNDELIELYHFIYENSTINDVVDIQNLKKDLELLVSQVERCNDILKRLSINSTLEDD